MRNFFLIMVILPFVAFCQNQSNIQAYKKNKMEQNQQRNTDESEILTLTRKFTALMISKNTSELNKIVDKNFTLTHITGYIQPKNEWFKEIESENMKYYSAEEVDFSLKSDGNKAKFVQKNRLDARIWGSRNVWRLQQTMTLEKRNEKWIILKSEAKTF